MSKDDISCALDRMTHGVYLICVKTERKTNAMTASWVTQAAEKPPIILVSVRKTHYTSELIPEAGVFSVNVLSASQYDLARKCGFGSGRKTDRLDGVETVYKTTGAPILKECSAYLDCKLVDQLDVGTHLVFAGEVVDAGTTSAPAMVFKSSDFF